MVLEQICDERIFDKSYMLRLALNQQTRALIEGHTNWMDDSTPLKIRCLAIYHGYTETTFPRCVVCNNRCTYNKAYMDKFSKYCSSLCSRTDKRRLSEEAYSKLNDYTWLYDQRIHQKKSFEEIANSLGCSETPVKKACNLLNVPAVRLNESEPLVMSKLRDKKLLKALHCDERQTVDQIAQTIGSSPATVSRWLNYHNIETNDSNSYDRKAVRTSKGHQEIVEFINSVIQTKVVLNNRSILGNKELDIFLPELNVAIEYNGVFYHTFRPDQVSESLRKGRNYHRSKTVKCEQQGIRLIHIFSDDWLYKKPIWKSVLNDVIKGPVSCHYARKLKIAIPSKTEKKIFLNENHLQGNDKSSIFYALYDNDDIICLITFCKSRYNKNYRWELSRFCVRKFYRCVGGFSRLLKHFRSMYPGSIISYADYSRSQGTVYLKNGFKMVKQNRPSYNYVNLLKSEKRLHRSNFKKQKVSMGSNKTEREIMYDKGFRQIFDCGTLVFVLE